MDSGRDGLGDSGHHRWWKLMPSILKVTVQIFEHIVCGTRRDGVDCILCAKTLIMYDERWTTFTSPKWHR